MMPSVVPGLSQLPQSAESIVRKGIGTIPEVNKEDKNAVLHARSHGLAVADVVSLASHADSNLSLYGSDARYKAVTRGMRDAVDAGKLGSVGNGKERSSWSHNQTKTISEERGRDGLSRLVESTTETEAKSEYIKAKDNRGVGVERHYTSTVVRNNSGQGAVKSARTLRETSADAAKGTLTQTLETETNSVDAVDGAVTQERRTTVTVFSMKKDGNLHKSIRDVLTLVVSSASGSILKTRNSESMREETLNVKNGTLSVRRNDTADMVDNTNKDRNLRQIIQETARVAIALANPESQDPKVGKVTIEGKRVGVSREQSSDGNVAQVSATQSETTFKGTGTAVDSASIRTYGQAAWRKANGDIGAGATERFGGFMLKKDEKDPTKTVLASSAASVKVANVGLSADNKIFVQAYNNAIDTDPRARGHHINTNTYNTSGDTTTADPSLRTGPYLFSKKWFVNTTISADTKNAKSGPYRAGGRYEIKNGILTIRAVDTRPSSPTVVLDIANRSMEAKGAPRESSVEVDAKGKLEAYNAYEQSISGTRRRVGGAAPAGAGPTLGNARPADYHGLGYPRTAGVTGELPPVKVGKPKKLALPKKLDLAETGHHGRDLVSLFETLQEKDRRFYAQNSKDPWVRYLSVDEQDEKIPNLLDASA